MTLPIPLFEPAFELNVAGLLVRSAPGGRGLRVTFDLNRSINPSPDSAYVQVYNLPPEQVTTIQTVWSTAQRSLDRAGTTPNFPATLRAGYGAALMGLFDGHVRGVRANVRLGTDVLTEFIVDDGGEVFDPNGSGLSIPTAGQTNDTLLRLALAILNDPRNQRQGAGFAASAATTALVRAAPPDRVSPFKSVQVANAAQILDALGRRLGARWWIRDRIIHMAQRGQPLPGPAVVVTGAAKVSETEFQDGYLRVSTFMDTQIVPGRLVVVDGFSCRVETARYYGDTRGGPWFVEILARLP